MEEIPEFANHRFSASSGADSKAHSLNDIGGASRNVNQWPKNWRDQKLHSKDQETIVNVSYPKTNRLSNFEERLIAMISPAAADEICLSDEDITLQVKSELDEDTFPQNASQPSNKTSSATRDEEQPLITDVKSEVVGNFYNDFFTSKDSDFPAEIATKDNTTIYTTDDKPIAVVEAISSPEARTPIAQKQKSPQTSGSLKMSVYERKLLGIKKAESEWRKEYEKKLLDLRERELVLREREMTLREREFSLKEKEFEMKLKSYQ